MKKIIAALTAFAAAMAINVFAEKYVSANDLELGTLTENKTLEDDFTIMATAEKNVEVTTQSADCPNSIATGEVFTQRIKLGGAGSSEYRNISFPAKAGQKVTVYCKSSSKTDSRTVNVCSADGAVVGTVEAAAYTGDISSGVVAIPADGNYYATSSKSTIYIYEIVIE